MKLVTIIRQTVLVALAASVPHIGFAQTFTDITSFTGNNSLGTPTMMLTQGRNAELYGTSFNPKGANGSVFSMTTSGIATVLYAFDYTTGSGPLAGVTLATDGNYYGATGGGGIYGYGVLFRISPNGAYTVLHNFSGADGAGPVANPIQASDGNLYGTTSGDAGVFSGTVYKYALSGTFTTIFVFGSTQGKNVEGLIQASDGNLYGTAWFGGTYDNGTIFELSTSGVLLSEYSFPGEQGADPIGGIIQAKDGNFYGTTYSGGASHTYGTIYRMNKHGVVKNLYVFKGSSDGANPLAGLMQATDGKLYGTTAQGGSSGLGTIFQITTGGAYKQLYSFTGTTGQSPVAAPMQHTNGLIYGATEYGGTYGYGVVYSLDMSLGPFITFVLASGKVGHAAEILGQGLTGTTSVTFNGVPATSFSVKSDTYMTAVVPSGATSGNVIVTTPSGTLTSNKSFRVLK